VTRYSFLTTWGVEAPLERVWDAIYDTNAWPSWWPGVSEVVELVPRGPDGIGGVSRFTFRSRLPYDLSFDMRSTRVERLEVMEGVASGELAGIGRWRFFSSPGATAVTYEWDVGTTSRWMNVLAPLGRPVFAWNHDHVMRAGARGLAELLDCRLLLGG
jgi:Polyketide cyclase / dehydrase and lipid transport